jgi:hypothetical protein
LQSFQSYLLSTSIVIALTGCASLADLQPPKEAQHFVLSSDYVRVEHRGLTKNLKVAEGFRTGTYRAVKEDADGIYFEGYGNDCVLVLVNAYADEYLATGKATSYEKRRLAGVNYGGGRGGLWLPKHGVRQEPRIFYAINSNNGPAPLLGITLDAIVLATDGALAFVPFGSEKEFLDRLKVLPGSGPETQCRISD